jgi:hypothetical protein
MINFITIKQQSYATCTYSAELIYIKPRKLLFSFIIVFSIFNWESKMNKQDTEINVGLIFINIS